MSEVSRAVPSVAVIGLGVMGGSLVRALAELVPAPTVVGFSPVAEEREAALAAGLLSQAPADAADAAASADLVIYAAPLRATLDLQRRHGDVWLPRALVSDVCSLMTPPLAQARALGYGERYVSAHPMVGSEASGFGASRDHLYVGARVWLSGAGADERARAAVESLWAALGSRAVWTSPEAHDTRMVAASHLPQLVANALARHLARVGLARDELGPGGRDMTRLAGSSPDLWRDLLEHSAPHLAAALGGVAREIDGLARALEARDLDGVAEIMDATRAWSSGLGLSSEEGLP